MEFHGGHANYGVIQAKDRAVPQLVTDRTCWPLKCVNKKKERVC